MEEREERQEIGKKGYEGLGSIDECSPSFIFLPFLSSSVKVSPAHSPPHYQRRQSNPHQGEILATLALAITCVACCVIPFPYMDLLWLAIACHEREI